MVNVLWGQDTTITDETQLTILDTEAEDGAVTEQTEEIPVPTVGWGDFLRMFLVLAFVIALIYGVFFLMKKFSRKGSLDSDQIRILTSKSLESGRNLHVIEVGNQVFLIGSAEGGISLVSEINDKETRDQFRLLASQQAEGTKSFQNVFSHFFPKEPAQTPTPTGSAKNSVDFIKKQRDRLKKLDQ